MKALLQHMPIRRGTRVSIASPISFFVLSDGLSLVSGGAIRLSFPVALHDCYIPSKCDLRMRLAECFRGRSQRGGLAGQYAGGRE
jgi:hypothetical protein